MFFHVIRFMAARVSILSVLLTVVFVVAVLVVDGDFRRYRRPIASAYMYESFGNKQVFTEKAFHSFKYRPNQLPKFSQFLPLRFSHRHIALSGLWKIILRCDCNDMLASSTTINPMQARTHPFTFRRSSHGIFLAAISARAHFIFFHDRLLHRLRTLILMSSSVHFKSSSIKNCRVTFIIQSTSIKKIQFGSRFCRVYCRSNLPTQYLFSCQITNMPISTMIYLAPHTFYYSWHISLNHSRTALS
jgi:hypothetical protein